MRLIVDIVDYTILQQIYTWLNYHDTHAQMNQVIKFIYIHRLQSQE